MRNSPRIIQVVDGTVRAFVPRVKVEHQGVHDVPPVLQWIEQAKGEAQISFWAGFGDSKYQVGLDPLISEQWLRWPDGTCLRIRFHNSRNGCDPVVHAGGRINLTD